jgi:hypothetical protein
LQPRKTGRPNRVPKEDYRRPKTPFMKHLRHRIETAQPPLTTPRMTARNPPHRHPRSTPPAVARHRDCGIFRTSWLKTASAGHRQQRARQGMQARRNPSLIEAGQSLNASRTPFLISCHGWSLHRRFSSAPAAPRETLAAHPVQSEKNRLPAPSSADEEPHPRWPSVPSERAGSPAACAV